MLHHRGIFDCCASWWNFMENFCKLLVENTYIDLHGFLSEGEYIFLFSAVKNLVVNWK